MQKIVESKMIDVGPAEEALKRGKTARVDCVEVEMLKKGGKYK